MIPEPDMRDVETELTVNREMSGSDADLPPVLPPVLRKREKSKTAITHSPATEQAYRTRPAYRQTYTSQLTIHPLHRISIQAGVVFRLIATTLPIKKGAYAPLSSLGPPWRSLEDSSDQAGTATLGSSSPLA